MTGLDIARSVAHGIVLIEQVGERRLKVSIPASGLHAIIRFGRQRAIGFLFRSSGTGPALLEAAPLDSLQQAVQWARERIVEWACRVEHEHHVPPVEAR